MNAKTTSIIQPAVTAVRQAHAQFFTQTTRAATKTDSEIGPVVADAYQADMAAKVMASKILKEITIDNDPVLSFIKQFFTDALSPVLLSFGNTSIGDVGEKYFNDAVNDLIPQFIQYAKGSHFNLNNEKLIRDLLIQFLQIALSKVTNNSDKIVFQSIIALLEPSNKQHSTALVAMVKTLQAQSPLAKRQAIHFTNTNKLLLLSLLGNLCYLWTLAIEYLPFETLYEKTEPYRFGIGIAGGMVFTLTVAGIVSALFERN